MAELCLGPVARAHRIQSSCSPFTGVLVHRIRLRSKLFTSLLPDQSLPFCISSAVSAQVTPRMEFDFWTDDGRSTLDEYMEHIRICNSGMERAKEFLPFVVEDSVVGYIHPGFAEHLSRFENVLSVPPNKEYEDNVSKPSITLNPALRGPEERTQAVAGVLEVLRKEGLIPGWRNELSSVVPSFGAPPLLAMERAAVPYFGAKAYGVHMNGYVLQNGKKHLWVAKRSATKQTFAGMLDHLVAGGQPHGLSCKENLLKECEEEAGISKSLAEKAIATGAVSYHTIEDHMYKRHILFCYDLELPQDFQPSNIDGEVESFMLLPVAQVSNILRTTKMYKPNCALVLIDFLVRHGDTLSSFKDCVVVIVYDTGIIVEFRFRTIDSGQYW